MEFNCIEQVSCFIAVDSEPTSMTPQHASCKQRTLWDRQPSISQPEPDPCSTESAARIVANICFLLLNKSSKIQKGNSPDNVFSQQNELKIWLAAAHCIATKLSFWRSYIMALAVWHTSTHRLLLLLTLLVGVWRVRNLIPAYLRCRVRRQPRGGPVAPSIQPATAARQSCRVPSYHKFISSRGRLFAELLWSDVAAALGNKPAASGRRHEALSNTSTTSRWLDLTPLNWPFSLQGKRPHLLYNTEHKTSTL